MLRFVQISKEAGSISMVVLALAELKDVLDLVRSGSSEYAEW